MTAPLQHGQLEMYYLGAYPKGDCYLRWVLLAYNKQTNKQLGGATLLGVGIWVLCYPPVHFHCGGYGWSCGTDLFFIQSILRA
ncbi:hypothetical protein GN956_G13995 [Arapaima gigas]